MKAKILPSYLSEKEHIFLSDQYELITGVVSYYSQYKSFQELFPVEEYVNRLPLSYDQRRDLNNVVISLSNPCYDKVITNWCNIFGSYSDDTHHTKLTNPGNSLSKEVYQLFNVQEEKLTTEILSRAGITEDAFSKYHAEMVFYRNNLVSHRTGEMPPRHPELKIALKTAFAYYSMLRELLSEFWMPTEERQYELIWHDTNATLDEMIKDGKSAFRDFLNIVKNYPPDEVINAFPAAALLDPRVREDDNREGMES